MKIAILSDSHDNIVNTQAAVAKAQDLGAEALIFCGDFCSPGAAIAMSKFKGPIWAVFGNNDGDKLHLFKYLTADRKDVTFLEDGKNTIDLAGLKIAITHYPLYADALARTGDYDLVCFGHDHTARIETYGKCLAVNPGALNPNPYRSNFKISFALYDSVTYTAEIIVLSDTE